MMMKVIRRLPFQIVIGTVLSIAPAMARAESVLRVVVAGELRSIDPVWTTAALTRYHSFMVSTHAVRT